MIETKTSLVTAVEVQASHHGDIKRNWQIPVRLEQRDSLTALVFHAPGVHPVVTVLLTGGDRIALIELLGGTVDVDVHH